MSMVRTAAAAFAVITMLSVVAGPAGAQRYDEHRPPPRGRHFHHHPPPPPPSWGYDRPSYVPAPPPIVYAPPPEPGILNFSINLR